jgi:hypothetical protein
MSAMEFKTSATATYSLATSLRVRRLALVVRGWLALDQRGPFQMNNETLISSDRSTSVTRISGGGAVARIICAFETARCRIIPISDKAEVSLCASA